MIENSIKNRVTAYSLVPVSLILILLAITVNYVVVDWLKDNFDKSLSDKGHALMTLLEEDEEGVEFEFADEFMPEYGSSQASEYFQLWYANGELLERSRSLLGQDLTLPALDSKNEVIADVELWDGRVVRQLTRVISPQLEPELRTTTRQTSDIQMVIAVASSRVETL
jgi:hypothetical protein